MGGGPAQRPAPAPLAYRAASGSLAALGTQRVRTVRGGFYGTEGRIPQTPHTGTRTLTITHVPSGRHLQLVERLNDTAAYTAPQTAIRYLPGLQRLLLLGAAQDRGMPLWQCVVLP